MTTRDIMLKAHVSLWMDSKVDVEAHVSLGKDFEVDLLAHVSPKVPLEAFASIRMKLY